VKWVKAMAAFLGVLLCALVLSFIMGAMFFGGGSPGDGIAIMATIGVGLVVGLTVGLVWIIAIVGKDKPVQDT
jgi:hypothetical protein